MKATVSSIFETLEIARAQRRKLITHEAVARSSGKTLGEGHYGSTLAACQVLQNALQNCEVEVELPLGSDEALLLHSLF